MAKRRGHRSARLAPARPNTIQLPEVTPELLDEVGRDREIVLRTPEGPGLLRHFMELQPPAFDVYCAEAARAFDRPVREVREIVALAMMYAMPADPE